MPITDATLVAVTRLIQFQQRHMQLYHSMPQTVLSPSVSPAPNALLSLSSPFLSSPQNSSSESLALGLTHLSLGGTNVCLGDSALSEFISNALIGRDASTDPTAHSQPDVEFSSPVVRRAFPVGSSIVNGLSLRSLRLAQCGLSAASAAVVANGLKYQSPLVRSQM